MRHEEGQRAENRDAGRIEGEQVVDHLVLRRGLRRSRPRGDAPGKAAGLGACEVGAHARAQPFKQGPAAPEQHPVGAAAQAREQVRQRLVVPRAVAQDHASGHRVPGGGEARVVEPLARLRHEALRFLRCGGQEGRGHGVDGAPGLQCALAEVPPIGACLARGRQRHVWLEVRERSALLVGGG
jgi:hypothetical protein